MSRTARLPGHTSAGARFATSQPALFDLTPSTIPNLVTAAGGTLIAIAGQESLVQPFLAAGYDAVIAPTEPCSDYDAALLFAVGFFYFARSEDAVTPPAPGVRQIWALHPPGPGHSDEQAVALAAAVDRDRIGGYRYHRRPA
jgi:hypothetical protein